MKKLSFDLGQAIKIPHDVNEEYYKIVQVVGEGKSATAYLALKTTVNSNDRGTYFVVKLLQNMSKKTSFNIEISNMDLCDHRSIMRVYDKGDFAANKTKYPFYICDFYPNDLTHFISDRNVKLTQKLSFAIQLCSALAYLSEKSIVHCDIKPQNIYADGFKCVIADFGLSRTSGENSDNCEYPSLHKYRTPDIVDAINNNGKITSKSDVFQLGLVLSELFTGVNPCKEQKDGGSEVVLDEILDIHGDDDKMIKSLIEEMLTRDPIKRPEAKSLIDRWQTIVFNAYQYHLKMDRNVY